MVKKMGSMSEKDLEELQKRSKQVNAKTIKDQEKAKVREKVKGKFLEDRVFYLFF